MAKDKRSLYGGKEAGKAAENLWNKAKSYRSRSYDNYFEGYTVRRVVDSGSKAHTERIYEGPYYVRKLSDPKNLAVKIFYGAAVLVSWLLLALSIKYTAVDQPWYTIVAQMAALLGLIWATWNAASYLMAGDRLTIGKFKSIGPGLRKSSAWCCGCFIFSGLCQLVGSAVSPTGAGQAGRFAVLSLLCAGLWICVNVIEKGIAYQVLQN